MACNSRLAANADANPTDTIDIDAWIDSVLDQMENLKTSTPLTIAAMITTEKKALIPLRGIDSEKFQGVSYLKFISSFDVEWNQKINAPRLQGKDDLDLVFLGSGANVIITEERGRQSLVFHNRQEKRLSVESTLIRKDPIQFVGEIFRALGYDGVVLAKNKGFYLVGMHANAIGPVGSQALAIKDSHNSFVMSQKDSLGAAILRSVITKNGFAVFEVILPGSAETIPLGTKVITERPK